MTDKELLELAAKASAVEGRRYVENEAIQGEYRTGLWCDLFENVWNPLQDDGDALRLAVKLQIDVKQYGDHVVAWFDGGFIGTGPIQYEGDPYAATCRAIVRAASEIGKAMQ